MMGVGRMMNKNEARDKRQVDTFAWFLEGERFRMWQKKPCIYLG
jgi:hypothetical protein